MHAFIKYCISLSICLITITKYIWGLSSYMLVVNLKWRWPRTCKTNLNIVSVVRFLTNGKCVTMCRYERRDIQQFAPDYLKSSIEANTWRHSRQKSLWLQLLSGRNVTEWEHCWYLSSTMILTFSLCCWWSNNILCCPIGIVTSSVKKITMCFFSFIILSYTMWNCVIWAQQFEIKCVGSWQDDVLCMCYICIPYVYLFSTDGNTHLAVFKNLHCLQSVD